MTAYDVIVLGLGGMGSAALDQLARRGARVLGLEQFDLVHDRGSSHGETRIIRKAYFEHPAYVPLLHRAYALWGDLERDCGETLFERCGLLVAGRPDGAVVTGVRRAAGEHRLAIDEIAAAEARRRFPSFAFDDDHALLFEVDAGFLRVEACVSAHLERARRAGAAVRAREEVLGWTADGRGVAVTTRNGRFVAARLVVCAGAWAGQLLPTLRGSLHVRRKVQLWLRCEDPRYAPAAGCPVFAYDLGDGFFYGFPALDGATVKVARHTGGEPVDDPGMLDRALCDHDAPPVVRFVRRYLPGVSGDIVRHAACMYTMTPDEHFVIDRHPQHERVFFAAGFSGHGFKFASVVGAVLADLALDGATREPIGFLRISRPALAACLD